MKSTPILMSGTNVRRILTDVKTETRRIINPQPVPHGESSYGGTRRGWIWPTKLQRSWNDDDYNPYRTEPNATATVALAAECPYGAPGDRLWVRPIETRTFYRADATLKMTGWKPSIFMPRCASRLTLEITGVRVERLQDMSEDDARAEGCSWESDDQGFGFRTAYKQLWETTNGPGSWSRNPWVWVIQFKRV